MSPQRRRRSGKSAAAKKNAREFWGSDADTFEPPLIRPADDPTVMLRSLGPPPLPGGEGVALHYFAAVTSRAAMVAVALATASDLLDHDDDVVVDDDDDGADAELTDES